jgi:hypothetical protein
VQHAALRFANPGDVELARKLVPSACKRRCKVRAVMPMTRGRARQIGVVEVRAEHALQLRE